MPHDGSRRQALGARGADVVLGQGLQHGGARHARQQRHVDQTQRQAGQHQVAQVRHKAVREGLVALHRQPAQLDGKAIDKAVADQEHRHRKRTDRADHHQAVQPAAGVPGRQHAQGYCHQPGEQHREEGDRHGRPHALADQLRYRHLRGHRGAQVAHGDVADPDDELLRQRLVQAQVLPDFLDVLGGRVVAGDHRSRIARRQVDQQEHHDRDDGHDWNDGRDAAQDVFHAGFPLACGRALDAPGVCLTAFRCSTSPGCRS
ncbi:hypothetical protein G6F65_017216 [Rhizopus arrhizus]|nr:hypothetical protein G6F65_017216 [Rhizopus arrhizus]